MGNQRAIGWRDNSNSNAERFKDKNCFYCGNIGHIKPNCELLKKHEKERSTKTTVPAATVNHVSVELCPAPVCVMTRAGSSSQPRAAEEAPMSEPSERVGRELYDFLRPSQKVPEPHATGNEQLEPVEQQTESSNWRPLNDSKREMIEFFKKRQKGVPLPNPESLQEKNLTPPELGEAGKSGYCRNTCRRRNCYT